MGRDDENTGQIVRDELLPRMAKQGSAIKVIAALVAVVFGAGVTWGTCSTKYETRAEAEAQSKEHAKAHQHLDEHVGQLDRDIYEIKGYVKAAAENSQWLRDRHEREDKRHGR